MALQYVIQEGEMIISGKTFEAKEWIKAAGGTWDPIMKVWRLAVEKATEEVCAKFGTCCVECKVYSWGKKITSCQKHARDGVSFRVNGRYYTGD
jgi:hypothetical protein